MEKLINLALCVGAGFLCGVVGFAPLQVLAIATLIITIQRATK